MSAQLLEKLLPVLEKMDWPQLPEATEQGRQAYMVGLERLDEYDGDVKLLSSALRAFQSGNSKPYACAGVAYTVLVAAQESDGRYPTAGLDESMKWLEQAQNLAPDIVEINVIEALIYTGYGRDEDARLVLDYLQEMDPGNYQLAKAEIAFWRHLGGVEETVHWFNEAAKAADNVPQRLRMRARLADYYFEQHMLDEALTIYKEAIHFDNHNIPLWHKISLIYWQKEDVEEAEKVNQQTLRLQADYAPAVKLHEAIKARKHEGHRTGRLPG
jgi:tetratricopeptide (TPR) repeat protein